MASHRFAASDSVGYPLPVYKTIFALLLLAAIQGDQTVFGRLGGEVDALVGAQATDVRIRIRAEVQLERDIGQPFGTVFEALDKDGSAVAGGYFSDAYSMFGQTTERNRLNCYVIDDRTAPCSESILRPFPDIPASRLIPLGGQLFAVPRMRLSPGVLELKGSGWQASQSALQLACEGFGGAQEVAGQVLMFCKQGVMYGKEIIFKPESGFEDKYFYYYADGVLIAFRYGDTDSGMRSLVRAFRWQPGQRSVSISDAFAAEELQIDYPLAFGTVCGRIVFALNTSPEVWALDGTFKRIFCGASGESWQAYCAMPFYDKLILGQYPSGSLFETDGTSVKPFRFPLPVLSDWPREAQCISVYRGELYAGLWPWGSVYRLRGSKWECVFRVIPQVPIRDEIAPYSTESERAGLVNNHWGQRVNSLVVHDNSLFASSMNKGGDPRGSAFVNSASAYGSVTRYTLPGSLGTTLRPGVTYEVEFSISKRFAILTVDGVVVDVCRGDFSAIAELKSIVWGSGIGGKFRGVIQKQQGWVTFGGGDPQPLPCKD